jgi:hypothetical protein
MEWTVTIIKLHSSQQPAKCVCIWSRIVIGRAGQLLVCGVMMKKINSVAEHQRNHDGQRYCRQLDSSVPLSGATP